MEKTNGNDPINPSPEWVSTENREHGLTKREYFAAMAMQGLTTNPEFLKTTNHITEEGYLKSLCESAVNSADALITELNKTP